MPLDIQPTSRLDAPARQRELPGCYSIRWACIYTQPQAEHWAETNLRSAGYTVWFPTHTVRVPDRVTPTIKHRVIRPLFPRYGFIQFNHHDTSWSPIRAVPGVVDLVRIGSEPAYTNDSAVSRLQALVASDAAVVPETGWAAPGVPCTVATGAFRGHEAVVEWVDPPKAGVALLVFGELRTVAIDVGQIQPR